MGDADLTGALQEEVARAFAQGEALRIRGAASKDFIGREPRGRPLDLGGHRGIVAYEPTELVLTARAGTPLEAIEHVLTGERQFLACEPPHLGAGATLGGTVACGLSGPRRPYAGAVRDFVLGVRIINGRGEVLRFGGQVMKNVAGYDVSRLMAGAFGTLGVILEVSLKVLPRPAVEVTLVREVGAREAIESMSRIAGRPLPLSAAGHWDGRLYLRLSGTGSGVEAARRSLGGEVVPEAETVWTGLREQRLPFFLGATTLWRLSLPPTWPPLDLPGEWLLDWGGAQRWLHTEADADTVRAAVDRAGGHATRFRGGDRQGAVFHPLPSALASLHRRIKQAFDPRGILNPGRLYPDL